VDSPYILPRLASAVLAYRLSRAGTCPRSFSFPRIDTVRSALQIQLDAAHCSTNWYAIRRQNLYQVKNKNVATKSTELWKKSSYLLRTLEYF
jgi:hypothetical protein